MAERKNFSRYNMRCGILIRAEEGAMRIGEIKKPETDSRYLFLTADDFSDRCSIPVGDSVYPLMAKGRTAFPGDIVLALFAPDYESAELMRRDLSIEYVKEENPEEEKQETPPDLEYGWGEFSPQEDDEKKYRTTESEFSLSHVVQPSYIRYTVTAWMDNANLHIEAPCEWMELVRVAVESTTGYPGKNIHIHPSPYTAKHDEYFITPAVLASIAAMATIKTGLPSELRDETIYSRPGIQVRRSTITDEEGKPLSETVSMSVDMGACPVFPEEYQRQAMAGLIPPYSLKEFKGTVSIQCSGRYPAAFAGSLGYSEAVASTEYHISKLAEDASLTPYLYRETMEREKRKFTDYLPGFELEEQKKTARKAVQMSTYERKWSANTFQKRDFGLLGYIRGIGMASAAGVSGFSTAFSKKTRFSAVMTYTQKGNITVNTSAISHPGIMRRWRKIISDRICPEHPERVIFLDYNPETVDTGPDVLSRIIASFTPQLDSAAKNLAVLKESEALPVSLRFDAENTYYPCEFENAGYGTAVCEVMISESDYIPVITELWASFSFPDILDETTLLGSVKRAFLLSLTENGVTIPPGFRMHIDITSTGTEGPVASVGGLVKALTEGALANALYQAGGARAAILPASAEKLEKALRKGGKE